MSTLLQKVQSGELTPIIYMPMSSAEDCHVNYGTGGNFVPNGVLDTAQRGANQYNCVASEFDGVDDYLQLVNPLTVGGKQFTISQVVKYTDPDNGCSTFLISDNTNTYYLRLEMLDIASGGGFYISAENSSSAIIVQTNIIPLPTQTTNVISACIDTSNQSVSKVFVNGKDVGATFSVFSDEEIGFSSGSFMRIGRRSTLYAEAALGELYFDTSYIDLATDNPFWDSTANKPKPVRQVLEETGNTPLIAMPISADNPTKNYGTGGDFTLNGGGLVGARGASEYIARTTNYDAGDYLTLSSSPIADSKTFTLVAFFKPTSSSTNIDIMGIGRQRFYLRRQSTNTITVQAKNSSSAIILDWDSSGTSYTAGTNNLVLLSVDLTSIGLADFFINGVDQGLGGIVTYTDDFIDFDDFSGASIIGADYSTGGVAGDFDFEGLIGFVYFTTEFIDFSQEENRNLFVDQLGYPKDLQKQIDDGLIPTPLIYMPFDDPDYLGKNLGTGGDFQINGTVTQGADFSI